MLIDKIEVTFKAGDGGNGKVSFRRNQKGPDGGNGGDGGNLFVVASSNLFLLNQFKSESVIEAQRGGDGGRNQKTGKNGGDFEVILPAGTEIIDKKTRIVILELNKSGERKILAQGGKGGLGNWEFRDSIETTPRFSEPGVKGEVQDVILNLKLIADFGLVGLPNTGKSSLLNELTNSKAQTANYNFTTLSPNLGVFEGRVIADIPGLIKGASGGKGLGIGFLKHIEKVKVLIHCISSDSENPAADYKTIRDELGKFNKELLNKKEIIVLTKSDLNKTLRLKNMDTIRVSIYDPESISKLKKILHPH